MTLIGRRVVAERKEGKTADPPAPQYPVAASQALGETRRNHPRPFTDANTPVKSHGSLSRGKSVCSSLFWNQQSGRLGSGSSLFLLAAQEILTMAMFSSVHPSTSELKSAHTGRGETDPVRSGAWRGNYGNGLELFHLSQLQVPSGSTPAVPAPFPPAKSSPTRRLRHPHSTAQGIS